MGMFRAYEVDSKGVAVATAATPVLYWATTSTNDCNVFRFRGVVEAISSPAPPTNGSVIFTINVVTGTVGGGGSVTPVQRSGATLAANTTFTSANAAAITGLTQSTQVAYLEVGFAAGAWEQDAWENTGFEINCAASTKYAVYASAPSGAGSGCDFRSVLGFAE
jgi:hypothetical protein